MVANFRFPHVPAAGLPCVVCRVPTAIIGVWRRPSERHPGHYATTLYGVCCDHVPWKFGLDRIEQAIRREIEATS